ncbi:DUF2316 family protein [Kitasatospora cineracea]|uniref:Uncharacterized protein n=1 Tax=Kitasatospora cineracea TaxID=88074 RepID=A0A3N4R9X6_9ACTN|nr:DUF2316 family protein [Kitasatospora cineracea]RPE29476.1 hypothetical protein EDD38_6632 [Kitasatospora cineracea]
MSLHDGERARTAAELRAGLELTGIPAGVVREELGYGEREFERILGVTGAAPSSVRRVRDQLEDLVREAGREPVPYSVLTERARAVAGRWFALPERARGGADRPSAGAS